MKLVAAIIAFGASLLPDQVVKMNFMTSLIVSTIVYYVVYVWIKRAMEI